MNLSSYFYIYAYSSIVAHMFYFHNLFLTWDSDLFAILVNNYPGWKMLGLTLSITVMITILIEMTKFK